VEQIRSALRESAGAGERSHLDIRTCRYLRLKTANVSGDPETLSESVFDVLKADKDLIFNPGPPPTLRCCPVHLTHVVNRDSLIRALHERYKSALEGAVNAAAVALNHAAADEQNTDDAAYIVYEEPAVWQDIDSRNTAGAMGYRNTDLCRCYPAVRRTCVYCRHGESCERCRSRSRQPYRLL